MDDPAGLRYWIQTKTKPGADERRFYGAESEVLGPWEWHRKPWGAVAWRG